MRVEYAGAIYHVTRTGKSVSVQLSRLAVALAQDRPLAKLVDSIERELKTELEVSNASRKG